MIRGLKFYFPFLVPLLIAVVFSVYVAFLDNPECAFLLGVNVSFLTLLVFCFVLPVIFATGSLYLLYFSIKVRRQDLYPPANVPWIGLFKKHSGRQAQISKAVGYLSPILSIWIIWLGISSFIEIADGRTLYEISSAIDAACKHFRYFNSFRHWSLH